MSESYVIFGAYGGIGSALCRRLAKRGAHLLLAGRNEQHLADLATELRAESFCLDASSLPQVESCMRRAADFYGEVNGVANCVGSLLLKPAHLISEEEWDATVATNLKSAFVVVRAAAITMTQKGGSVVLLSTAAARIGLPNHEVISAAKAGVEGLTRALAQELGTDGIRVNCIIPGWVMTPRQLAEAVDTEAAATIAREQALTRRVFPDDIARMALWLAADDSSACTGQNWIVDGGWM